MFDNKTIGKRFADLRKSKKDKNGKDMPIRQLANELSDEYIKEYKADIIRQEIGKVENKDNRIEKTAQEIKYIMDNYKAVKKICDNQEDL